VQDGLCTGLDSAIISEDFLPELPFGNADTFLCSADSLFLDARAENCNGGCTFLWSTGETTPTRWITEPGVYSLQIENNCGVVNDTFTLATDSLANFYLEDTFKLCGKETTTLSAQSTGGGSLHRQATWQWFADGIAITTPEGTTSALSISTTGLYLLRATTSCGTTRDSTQVIEDPQEGICIPNVFSPNGDEINEVFKTEVENKENFEIYIFDRWGRLWYNTTDPDQFWSGRDESNATGSGKGTDAPAGVYFYGGKALNCRGEQQKLRGNLTLLR
jgi:gliding motility-associated-like protein